MPSNAPTAHAGALIYYLAYSNSGAAFSASLVAPAEQSCHLRRQLRDGHRDVMFLHAQEPADADDGVRDSFVGRHDTALSEFPHFGLLTHWPSITLAAEID